MYSPTQPEGPSSGTEQICSSSKQLRMTTLTPSYHAENYSPDDNRFVDWAGGVRKVFFFRSGV